MNTKPTFSLIKGLKDSKAGILSVPVLESFKKSNSSSPSIPEILKSTAFLITVFLPMIK